MIDTSRYIGLFIVLGILFAVFSVVLLSNWITRTRTVQEMKIRRKVNALLFSGKRSRIVALDDVSNVTYWRKDRDIIRAYAKFIEQYATNEITCAHRALKEAGVRHPSTRLTGQHIESALTIINTLDEQGYPARDLAWHWSSAHAVLHPEDTELLKQVIWRGVDDKEEALALIQEMRAGTSKPLQEGAL